MAVTVTWIEFNGSQKGWPAKGHKGRPAIGAQTAIPPSSGQKGISGSYPVKNLNFGSVDSTNIVAQYYPIPAGTYSYPKYVKLQFSGSFTTIDTIKLWRSDGLALKPGESVLFSGNVVKNTTAPNAAVKITTTHPGAGSFIPKEVPTSTPQYPNVCSQNTTAGSLPIPGEYHSSPGYYSGVRASTMVFQLVTSTDTPAGSVNTKTFSIVYNRT